MEFVLTHPMIITPRLLPGARIGKFTMSVDPIMWDGRGYTCAYFIDGPDGELYSAQDLCIRMVAEQDLAREAVRVLCSFLGSDAEAYAGSGQMGTAEPVDGYSFNTQVAEWAYMHSGEIDELGFDLGE